MKPLSIILSLLFIVIVNFSFSQKNENYTLNIKKSLDKGEATLFLNKNNSIIDSLLIDDLDFEIDSLVQINDFSWKYMYSFGLDYADIYMFSRQIIIQVLNDKIHVALVSLHKDYLIQFKEENYPFTTIDKRDYDLNYNDTKGFSINLTLNERTESETDTIIEFSNELKNLVYDTTDKVFCNYTVVLNGDYSLMKNKFEVEKKRHGQLKKTHIENERVSVIDIGKSKYIYYKKRWYATKVYPDQNVDMEAILRENN